MAGCGADDSDSTKSMTLRLQGRVMAPAIVIGATIEFYSLAEDERRLLTATLTDPAGAFDFEVSGLLVNEPLLICTGEGGKTTDSWTGQEIVIPESMPLCAIYNISAGLADELLMIDPWSTLAFGLAQGYRAHGSKLGIASDAWSTVIPKATERLAAHLSQESPPNIGFTDPADPAVEMLSFPSARMGSGLSAAGLANVAADWPPKKGGKAPTMPELLSALVADSLDGVFDGQTPSEEGESVTVKLGAMELTANTLRYELAKGIHEVLTQTEVTFADGIDAVELFNGPDGWYKQLSMASGTLFSELPPNLFDPLPPTIILGSEFPERDELLGSSDLLHLKITAIDPHGVDALWLESPEAYADRAGKPVTKGTEFALPVDFDPTVIGEQKVLFQVRARDVVGNESSVDRSFRIALGSPTISELLPPSEICLPDAPLELLVFVMHPDELSTEVSLNTKSGPIACELGSDGYHHCNIDLADGAEVTVVATDSLGRTDEATWELCVDGLPPTIIFDPEDDSWYSPESAEITILVSDDHEVTVTSLLVDGEETAVTMKLDEITVPLPTTEDTSTTTVTITATDIADLQTEATATYKFDGVPPSIEGPELGIFTNSFEYIEQKFRVLDPASGVASVVIIGGQGIWTLEYDEKWYKLVGTVVPLPGVPTSVTVQAEDMVGNTSSRTFVVFLDSSTPVITQKPTFVVSDIPGSPTYDAATGEVDYAEAGADLVSLNKTSCEEVCPPFAKFAPLLFGVTLPEDLEQQVPSFTFDIDDPCPTGAIKPTLKVVASWYAGEELVHEAPSQDAKCLGDTLSIPLLLPLEEGVGEFPAGLIPDRLHIEATDLGGQVATHDVLLEMTVLPPPLFLLDDAEEAPDDPLDLYLLGQTPALHEALAGGTYYRRRLLNPTVVAADLTLESLPLESLLISHARIYVQPDEPVGTACPALLCRFIGGESDGQCTNPESFSIDTWYMNDSQQVRLRRHPTEGDPALILPGNSFTLDANQWNYLDIVSGAAESPIDLEAPITVALEGNDGHKVHLASPEILGVACTWNTGLPPEVTHYDLPDIITGYVLKIEADASLGFDVALEGLGEGSSFVTPIASQIKTYAPPFPLPLSVW